MQLFLLLTLAEWLRLRQELMRAERDAPDAWAGEEATRGGAADLRDSPLVSDFSRRGG